MNLGRRRITNDDLCTCFAAMGFDHATAFLASGNVIFQAKGPADRLEGFIARELESSLGYQVPTFVRSAPEVRAIADHTPFSASTVQKTGGRVQVVLFATQPSLRARHGSCDRRGSPRVSRS